jgi:RNA polymerase sigma-70 factor, ECF subfamily
LKGFSNLASFRGEAKFSTWLVQITNEAKMKLRRPGTHLYESIDDKQEDGDGGDYSPKDFADWRPIPSELLEVNEMTGIVQNAINSHSSAYREVLILKDVQLLSVDEVAMNLGISRAAVKTQLHRAQLLARHPGAWVRRLLDPVMIRKGHDGYT